MFFVDASTDRIGIGTNTPVTKLEILEGVTPFTLSRDIGANNSVVGQFFRLDNSVGTPTNYAIVKGGILSNTAGAEFGFLTISTIDNGTLATSTVQDVMTFRNSSTGPKAGMGLLTPVTTLDIAGFDQTSSNFAFRADNSGGNNILIVRNDNRVGILTASPTEAFSINNGNNLALGNTALNGSATNSLGILNGTAPAGIIANLTQVYSADWNAGGTATLHALNEEGHTFIYKQSAAYTRTAAVVEDRTLLASASATTINNNNVLAALIVDLQGNGLLG